MKYSMSALERLDIIGDVHGNVRKLRRMLDELGYVEDEGVYRHARRDAVFVGDLVNRGPHVREVVRIVRAMHEAGQAWCILGNHELNLLAWFTRNARGQWLKPHTSKARSSLAETLNGSNKRPDPELREILDWLRELPLWLDFGRLRVVHASWHHQAVELLSRRHRWIEDLIPDSNSRNPSPEQQAVMTITKGPAISVNGSKLRVRWWMDPRGRKLGEVLMPQKTEVQADPDKMLSAEDYEVFYPYPEDAPPVVFGHYGIPDHPVRYLENVACVDYGAARGGRLCAYRWDGEATFDPDKFVFV